MLIAQKKSREFLQIIHSEIRNGIKANWYNKHTKMVYEKFMVIFYEIYRNGSLSLIKKLQLILIKITISVHDAFYILAYEQCLLLRDLLQENRTLNQDQHVLIYNYLTLQTPEPVSPFEVASQSHEQDPSSEFESQMDEQDLLTELTLENYIVQDRYLICDLDFLFRCECILDAYYVAFMLIAQKKSREFMQIIHSKIRNGVKVNWNDEHAETVHEEFMEIFYKIYRNNSLPLIKKLQLILIKITISVHVAFYILAYEQCLLLRDLLQENRTLNQDQHVLIYNYLASQAPESNSPSEFELLMHELDLLSEFELQMHKSNSFSESQMHEPISSQTRCDDI
jgi:hypothetical protein